PQSNRQAGIAAARSARGSPELRENLVYFQPIALLQHLGPIPTWGTRRPLGLRKQTGPARWRRPSPFPSPPHLCHANFRSCSPLASDRRFRPALLHARRLRGRSGLSALQYRAHRRERLSHLGGGGRLWRERAFDRGEGKHADDQRRETDEGREEQ